MARPCGAHHGQHMAWPWGSWLGAGHPYLPWQGHVELTMGSTWHGLGAPGWVQAIHIFHGKAMWSSPWAAHGMALGLLAGCRPSISSMARPCGAHHGQHMAWPWGSWLGAGH